MRVSLINSNRSIYSCNSYFVRGEWNAIPDINTLIDAGTDGSVSNEIDQISTGVGKKRLEQIILTHEHFDHSGGLSKLKEIYDNPKVFAFNLIKGVDEKLYDGMNIKMGDEICDIIHVPVHSQDSICIYCPKSKVLFSGDTILFIKTIGGTYSKFYLETIERFYRMDIRVIYSGHDEPVREHIRENLLFSIKNIRNSEIVI